MIEFLCPEGHKIRCPKERAGRPAKCPKCGVGFRIPTIEELGLGGSTVADASLAGDELADVPAAPSSPGGGGSHPPATSKERQIEFLCPNGHHLHGPASLQGKGGECPECGSRFRIPVVDEPKAEAELPVASGTPSEPKVPAEEEITLENPPSAAEPTQSEESPDLFEVREDGGPASATEPGAAGGPGQAILDLPSGANRGAPGIHPLAALFSELWAVRGEGSRVEVHLESGSVLLPDGYLKSHSQQDYAVLVTRDPDGCSTITVVPWNSISRIIMRAVKQVPGEVVR